MRLGPVWLFGALAFFPTRDAPKKHVESAQASHAAQLRLGSVTQRTPVAIVSPPRATVGR